MKIKGLVATANSETKQGFFFTEKGLKSLLNSFKFKILEVLEFDYTNNGYFYLNNKLVRDERETE